MRCFVVGFSVLVELAMLLGLAACGEDELRRSDDIAVHRGGAAGSGGEAGAGGAVGSGAVAGSGGAAGSGAEAGAAGAVDTGEDCSICEEAEALLGYRSCVCRVPDASLWESITVPVGTPFERRATKYTLPARDDARMPGTIMDANAFVLHYEFLRQAFPDRFGDLGARDYLALILDPEQREFYAGNLSEFALGGQAVLYGFTVWDDPADPATTITCDQARAVYTRLDPRFDLVPLAFVPSSANQRDALGDCDVPSYDPETGIDYEVYAPGVGYGTLRRYTLSELAAATETHEFGWQDILVLDEAPIDVEAIISGAVTGTRQGALSHLNVRSAARGTPNCYIDGAYDLLEGWEGRLLRLECGNGYFTVDAATPEEANVFWDALRPTPITIAEPDRDWSSTANLLDVPTDTPELRAAALQRYGAKGANLATLYQRMDPDCQFSGFVVPMRHYLEFVETRTWTVDLGSGPELHTFVETLNAWLSDATFRTDGRVRRERLATLRDAMESTGVDVDLSTPIRAYGNDTVMLRFRSSSNAEDALEFTGAGLYESVSGCLADDLDGDEVGPSGCDADESRERTVARALARVWASLWNAQAYEERDWYGIDHARAAMAILVNPRTQNERANIVAFTGNPTSPGDDRYVVDAQAGELDVVLPDPGVFPEESLLTVSDGTVSAIERVQGSSELPAGSWVLDDARLGELGGLLWQIAQVFPVDGVVPPDATVLLDTEWKILPDGSLIVKQVRPFLRW
jgi:pyruvate,water dikinase